MLRYLFAWYATFNPSENFSCNASTYINQHNLSTRLSTDAMATSCHKGNMFRGRYDVYHFMVLLLPLACLFISTNNQCLKKV